MERIIHEFHFSGKDISKETKQLVMDKARQEGLFEDAEGIILLDIFFESLDTVLQHDTDTDFTIDVKDEQKERCGVSPLLKVYDCEDLKDFL